MLNLSQIINYEVLFDHSAPAAFSRPGSRLVLLAGQALIKSLHVEFRRRRGIGTSGIFNNRPAAEYRLNPWRVLH